MWGSLSGDLPPGLQSQEALQEMTSELEEQELPRAGGQGREESFRRDQGAEVGGQREGERTWA